VGIAGVGGFQKVWLPQPKEFILQSMCIVLIYAFNENAGKKLLQSVLLIWLCCAHVAEGSRVRVGTRL